MRILHTAVLAAPSAVSVVIPNGSTSGSDGADKRSVLILLSPCSQSWFRVMLNVTPANVTEKGATGLRVGPGPGLGAAPPLVMGGNAKIPVPFVALLTAALNACAKRGPRSPALDTSGTRRQLMTARSPVG